MQIGSLTHHSYDSLSKIYVALTSATGELFSHHGSGSKPTTVTNLVSDQCNNSPVTYKGCKHENGNIQNNGNDINMEITPPCSWCDVVTQTIYCYYSESS